MKIPTTILLALVLNQLFCQYSGTVLDRNNVSVYISNGGDQFINPTSGGGYLVPKDDGIKAIYSARFLYMGKDQDGVTHAALGGSLNPNYGTDVFIGPYATNYSDGSYQDVWSTCIYRICQEEIDIFVTWWECENGIPNPDCATAIQPTSELLNKIYTWPCHGNVDIGQAYYILPFVDRDGDGVYNPANGDHPKIKGCCGTYVIQNDTRGFHSYSSTPPIGLEMQYHFYQYSSTNYLNDATFVEVTTINRGSTAYPEFRHGMYVDGDLGNFSDDYFGSDSLRNMAYFYNADNFDQADFGQPGYEAAPPALGFVGLEDTMNAVIRFDSASGTDDWWDLMNGLENGLPQQHPDGYTTQLAYSGYPSVAAEWSEVSAGSPSSERRIVFGSEQNMFLPGDTIKQTYAILYARGGSNIESVQLLKVLADSVLEFHVQPYDVGCIGSVLSVPESEQTEFSLFPNPANDEVHIRFSGEVESVTLIDLQGRRMRVELKSKDVGYSFTAGAIPSGVYILEIKNSERTFTERLVVE